MIFIESPVFTEDVQRLLTDESYANLQLHLAEYPFTGDLTPKEKQILRKLNEEWNR